MRKELLIILISSLLICLLPLFVHGDRHIMNVLVMCLIFASLAASWDLIMGFAGIFTFAQIPLFTIGAYASAIVSMQHGASPWIGICFAGFIGCIAGILIGLPCLHLKGSYVALVTFAVYEALDPLIKSDIGRFIGTGGTSGLINIPSLNLGKYVFSTMDPVPWFYAALILMIISFLLIYRIINSTWGLAFIGIRDSEHFAKCLGVNDYKYKVLVFAASSFIAGMVGGFYAHYVGVVSTKILGLDMFIIVFTMITVGGIGQFPGTLFGAFAVVFFNEMMRPLGEFRVLTFGILIIVLVIFMPTGLAGLVFPEKRSGAWYNLRQLVRQWFGNLIRAK